MQIGKEYLCTENQCNDLTGDRIDLSPPNPSGVSGPVDPDRQRFKNIYPLTHFTTYRSDLGNHGQNA